MEQHKIATSLQKSQPKKENSLEKNELIHMQIKELIKEKLYNSFAQAIIAFFATRNKILKLCIFLFVIVSSGLAAYLVISAILTYLTYPVLTSTRTLFETPTLFPKITICNQNTFITEYALEWIKMNSLEIPPHTDIFNSSQTFNLNYTEKINLVDKINSASLQIMSSLDMYDDMRLKMAHSFDDILAGCSFNSKSIIKKKD